MRQGGGGGYCEAGIILWRRHRHRIIDYDGSGTSIPCIFLYKYIKNPHSPLVPDQPQSYSLQSNQHCNTILP